jgi:predicted dinucleotide-binding enzyme
MILGAGVQGTLYAVRFVRVGHDVTVIARGMRAAELRRRVAHIEEALTSRTDTMQLPVKERLSPDVRADVCLVAVRREQISEVLPDLAAAVAIRRVNQASFRDLGASRSSSAHMCVFSACSSEYSLCDDAMVLWQRRHIESLVPS